MKAKEYKDKVNEGPDACQQQAGRVGNPLYSELNISH